MIIRHCLMLVFFLMAYPAFAATSYNVGAGASSTITEFSVCRIVTNNNSKAMMVATNTAFAWNNFLTHVPANVTARTCGPTLVQNIETPSYGTTTTPQTTASFNVQTGDILVAYLVAANGARSYSVAGGSLTWTLQKSVHSDVHNPETDVWTAVVDANKSMTVTFSSTGSGAVENGGGVFTFRNSNGVGASAKAVVATGAPTVNITTTRIHSAIVVVNSDWNAVDGASRVWRTNAGPLTETRYAFYSGIYTVFIGYHPDVSAIGTYAVGLSAPTGQLYGLIGIEIKGP